MSVPVLLPLPLPFYVLWGGLFGLGLGGDDGMALTSLFQNSTTTGNPANTNETDLHVYTMPGGTLATDGDSVMVYALVQNAGNANNKQTRLRFGGTLVGDSTIIASNNNWFVVRALIIRTSATAQKALCWSNNLGNAAAWTTAAGGAVTSTTPAETLSGDVDIKVTGQSNTTGAANDVQAVLTVIFKIPASA